MHTGISQPPHSIHNKRHYTPSLTSPICAHICSMQHHFTAAELLDQCSAIPKGRNILVALHSPICLEASRRRHIGDPPPVLFMSGVSVGVDLVVDMPPPPRVRSQYDMSSGLVAYVGGGVVADKLRVFLDIDVIAADVTLTQRQHRHRDRLFHR